MFEIIKDVLPFISSLKDLSAIQDPPINVSKVKGTIQKLYKRVGKGGNPQSMYFLD